MARMPFGKHKGWDLSEIPSDYLELLLEEVDLRPQLRRNVLDELDRRAVTERPDDKNIDEMVNAWVRKWRCAGIQTGTVTTRRCRKSMTLATCCWRCWV